MTTPSNFHDLSSIEQGQVNDALTDIAVALDDVSVLMREQVLPILPARLYDEVRAYFGTIRDAQHRLCELFYNVDVRERDPLMTDDEAAALIEPVGEHIEVDPAVAVERIVDGKAIGLEALIAQLDRGVINNREFAFALEAQRISQSHPCQYEGCTNIVPFDDEPMCFTHSPDEGSSVPGYSYIDSHYPRGLVL